LENFFIRDFFALVFSIPWDIFAGKNNIWFFPKEGNMGIYLGFIPLEEYFFYIGATFFAATITVIFKYQKIK
jgi:lycopene cyclase domain-containing protein